MGESALATRTASRRSAAASATRERLLQAAMQVFAAKGYHGTTVDDVVAASATSKGAFYHYFGSKRDIFLTLVDTLAGLVEAAAEAAIDGEPTGLAKVEAALRIVLTTAEAHRDLVKILLVEAVALGPELEEKRLEIHRRFAALIQRHLDAAVADGAIPPQNTSLAARAWLGTLNEVITQWLASGQRSASGEDGGGVTRHLADLRALLLRSIGAKEMVR